MINILLFAIIHIIINQFYVEAIRKGELKDDNIDSTWHGMWFPFPPDYHNNNGSELFQNANSTKTIVTTTDCDNGKDNIAIDYDPENKQHSYNYLCLTPNKSDYEPNINKTALLKEYYVPPVYVPVHKCLNESLYYTDSLPTYGSYRPLAPKYGTYRYLPPQRWVHSLAKGAIVMLFHPCAYPSQIKLLQNTVKSSIYRHIISPSLRLLDPQRPMALLAWGKYLAMSVVDERIVLNFIKDNAKWGAKLIQEESESNNNYYDIDLLQEAHLITDALDNNIFDTPT